MVAEVDGAAVVPPKPNPEVDPGAVEGAIEPNDNPPTGLAGAPNPNEVVAVLVPRPPNLIGDAVEAAGACTCGVPKEKPPLAVAGY